MKKIAANILSNIEMKKGFFRMTVGSEYLARRAKPGQFVHVRCGESLDPLLRRPLGVHRIRDNSIDLLYEVVGRGTAILAGRKRGETISLIGPLGRGFDIDKGARVNILVAGGIGVAPLLALAEKLPKKNLKVLIGACKKAHLLCEKDFGRIGADLVISTDDGSKGYKGFVTDILKKVLNVTGEKRLSIYACGPAPMLKEAAKIAGERNIPCQVSLEEKMACGVGVCLGCPVKVKTLHAPRSTNYVYKMVCKDGPVFDSREIVW